jgi:hypothetical protein
VLLRSSTIIPQRAEREKITASNRHDKPHTKCLANRVRGGPHPMAISGAKQRDHNPEMAQWLQCFCYNHSTTGLSDFWLLFNVRLFDSRGSIFSSSGRASAS